MSKLTLNINDDSETHAILKKFGQKCLRFKTGNAECETLFNQVKIITHDLVSRGQELNAIGSQFHVTHIVESPICDVIININLRGKKPSVISKILSFFRK